MIMGDDTTKGLAVLRAHGALARSWALTVAFPLWSTAGRDVERGGFHESLTFEAKPTDDPRRAFVQARQAYSFCEAGRMGWQGDWADAAHSAIDYLLSRFVLPSGAVIHKTDVFGHPIDSRVTLYDCAFTTFALAHVFQMGGRGDRERLTAERILDFLNQQRAHPISGFFDEPNGVLSQNPHMHLLEAALAWIDAGGDDRWWALAEDLVEHASRYLMAPDTGAIFEDFAADWSPLGGVHNARIEPGHLYEWAYLLSYWSRLKDGRHDKTPARLFFLAERHGRDPERGVAICAIDPYFRQTNRSARLWAQTERLRAAIVLAPDLARRDQIAALAAANEAATAIECFLNAPMQGLWRDDWRPAGDFADKAVRASSLYHILSSYRSLIDAANASEGEVSINPLQKGD